MIPIKDNIPSRTVPVVLYALILLNAYIFYQELTVSDDDMEMLLEQFGLVPADFLNGWKVSPWSPALYIPFVTNLFFHGGWLHIIGNMWYLRIFGDNIEDRLGHGSFLLFYLLCGVAANAAQIFVEPAGDVPTIGASGAISGVLGAYLIRFPQARVSVLVPLFIWIWRVFEIPAALVLGLWFVMQVINGALAPSSGGGVAWMAHVGGFIAGVMLMRARQRRTPRLWPWA